MRRTALLCTLWMALSAPALAEERQVVAIFELEAKGLRLDAATRDRLTDYLSSLLAAEPVFQVVPRAQVKSRLRDAKTDSYRACYDEGCQIEIGRELAAQKTLNAQVLKLADQCKLSLTLYDLRHASTDKAATESGGCEEAALVASIERAMAALLGRPAPAGGQPKVDLKLQALQLGAVPKEMRVDGSAVPTDIDPDLLVLYEDALARDKDGQKKPQEALVAWKAVSAFKKGKNPFKADAAKRVKEWEKFAASRAKLEKQHAQDRDKLQKLLGLKLMKLEQKTELFRGFIERYALAFGLPELEALAAVATPAEAGALKQALFTRELYDGLCKAEDKRACEELARVDREAAASKAEAELQSELARHLAEGWVVVEDVIVSRFGTCKETGGANYNAKIFSPKVIPLNEPGLSEGHFTMVSPETKCLNRYFLVRRPEGYASAPLILKGWERDGNTRRDWVVPVAKGKQCALRTREFVESDFHLFDGERHDARDSSENRAIQRLMDIGKQRSASYCSRKCESWNDKLYFRQKEGWPEITQGKLQDFRPISSPKLESSCYEDVCYANAQFETRCAFSFEALDMSDCRPVNP